jgi:archaellum component FlaC
MSPFGKGSASVVFRLFITVTFASNLWLVVDFEFFKDAVGKGMVALVQGNEEQTKHVDAVQSRVDFMANKQIDALRDFEKDLSESLGTAENERRQNWGRWDDALGRIENNVDAILDQTKQTRDHTSTIEKSIKASNARTTRAAVKAFAPQPHPWFHIP